MKIGVDLTFINAGEINGGELHNGITISTAYVLMGIQKMGRSKDIVLIIREPARNVIEKYLPDYKKLVVGKAFDTIFYLSKRKTMVTGLHHSSYLFAREIKKMNFDFIWYPYYTPEFANRYLNVRSVYTINDLIPLHNTTKINWKKKRVSIFKKRLVENCKIVTISNYVKKDVNSLIGIPLDEIDVVNDPIIPDYEMQKKPDWLDFEYILDINAYSGYKNTITLIKAFRRLKNTDLHLVCTGAWIEGDYLDKLKEYVAKHNLEEKVHLLYRIPGEEKNYLFMHAKLFVSPSMDEGFGLTPVEAAICKIPVLTTKEASLYEATRGLVHYYDKPKDYLELADKISSIIEKTDSIDELESISKKLKEAYSIDNSAKGYWKIFRGITRKG